VILVELTAAVDQYGTLRTFYLGTDGFTTSPADTPANTTFLPELTDAGSISLWAFAEAATSGSSQLKSGEVTANNNGQFDSWKDYSFDGRPVTIRYGSGGAYPGDFTTIFTGTITSVSVTLSKVTVSIVDRAKVFDLPVLTALFLGTNSGPTGLEGLATDLKGKPKPRTYGKPREVGPPCVNTSKLTYRVSDRAVDDISAVYDRGASITKGADYATSALLTAATVGAGTYATSFAEGLFRLGSSATGQITCNPVAGGSDALRTVAETLKQLAQDAGIPAGSILASDVGELNAVAPSVIGLYLADDTTFRSAMDQVAASAHAWWAFDPAGVLRMGQLAPPSGAADIDIIEADVQAGFECGSADGSGIPVYRVTVRHSKFFTVQTSDVAGSVTDARRSELAQEFRTVSVEDASIRIQSPQARELVVDTLLTSDADAAIEAAQLLAIHKVRRFLFTTPVPVWVFTTGLMRLATLTHRRFGLSLSRTLAVLGFELDLARSRVIAKLWG
jgi:hypothetical protein